MSDFTEGFLIGAITTSVVVLILVAMWQSGKEEEKGSYTIKPPLPSGQPTKWRRDGHIPPREDDSSPYTGVWTTAVTHSDPTAADSHHMDEPPENVRGVKMSNLVDFDPGGGDL